MLAKLKQLPKYVKVIIAIVLTSLFGLIVACVVLTLNLKNSFTPEFAAKVLSQMVGLPDPLPRGWSYGVGMDVGYQKTANIYNRRRGRGHAMIQFNQMQLNNEQTAEEVADRFVMPNVAGMTVEVDSRGEEEIAGQTAFYIRQHGRIMGKLSAYEIVFVDIPSGGILQIQSTEDGYDRFDPEIVAPILTSITRIGKP